MRTNVLDVATELGDALVAAGFGPFLGTPCGILAPLLRALDERVGVVTVAREDNAVGMAAGAALAGRCPVVLMQNSGLGQSVNAIASLVTPYRLPMLFVVSLRGIDPDPTQENLVMGRLTRMLLDELDVETSVLDADVEPVRAAARAAEIVRLLGRAAALLIPPPAFGWHA